MNNEGKILELLAEVLQKQDKQGGEVGKLNGKLDKLTTAVQNNAYKIDNLINVVARQNTALQNIARDIQDLKTIRIDIEELKRRVDELERYTGKS